MSLFCEKHRTGYLFLLACLLDPHPMEGPIKSQFVCLLSVCLYVCLSVSIFLRNGSLVFSGFCYGGR